eukprot:g4019.t1
MDVLQRGGSKILPVVPQLIMPLKEALNTRDPDILCRVMQIISALIKSTDMVGEALVPYYRQLLPVFNLFINDRVNIGDKIDYGQRKKKNLGDLMAETLDLMERNGGEDAFINIKYMIPTFESFHDDEQGGLRQEIEIEMQIETRARRSYTRNDLFKDQDAGGEQHFVNPACSIADDSDVHGVSRQVKSLQDIALAASQVQHAVRSIVAIFLLVISIAVLPSVLEVFGGSAPPHVAVLFFSLVSAPFMVITKYQWRLFAIVTVLTSTISLIGPAEQHKDNVANDDIYGPCLTKKDINEMPLQCDEFLDSPFHALHPALREFPAAIFKRGAELLLSTVSSRFLERTKADVCNVMFIPCDTSCTPYFCGLKIQYNATNPFPGGDEKTYDRFKNVFGRQTTEFVFAAMEALNDVTHNKETYTKPCKFSSPKPGDRCFIGGKQEEERKDARIARKVVECLLLLMLIVSCLQQVGDDLFRCPTFAQFAGFLVIAIGTALIVMGYMRLGKSLWVQVYASCAAISTYHSICTLMHRNDDDSWSNAIDIVQFLPKNLHQLNFIINDIMDPSSNIYLMYIFAMEVIEIVVQMLSVISRAKATDAQLVLVHCLLVACNLELLPVLFWSSRTRQLPLLVTAMALEISFDKGYMLLSLFSSEPGTFFEHIGFLAPSVMTIFTARAFGPMWKRKAPLPIRHLKLIVVCCTLLSSSIASYIIIAHVNQSTKCTALLGDVAECSSPKLYFENGLFMPLSCGLKFIRRIDCHNAKSIPGTREYEKMVNLEIINVSSSNISSVPWEWAMAPGVRVIDMSNTRICSIPWLGYANLKSVFGSDCLSMANWSHTGLRNIEYEWVGGLRKLRHIDLSSNNLTHLPLFDGFDQLQSVDLQNNEISNFESHPRIEFFMKNNPIKVAILTFSSRRFMDRWKEFRNPTEVYILGELDGNTAIVEFMRPSLKTLVMSPKRNVQGQLPSSLGNLVHLETLVIPDSFLHGAIPASLGKLHNLREVALPANNLEGTLSSEFGQLQNLARLDLKGNKVGGNLPSNLSWPALTRLVLSNNNFQGTFPESLGYTSGKLTRLSLDRNNFSGSLPSSLGNLKELVHLDLNSNTFHGTIPASLGNLTKLKEASFLASKSMAKRDATASKEWTMGIANDLMTRLIRTIPEHLYTPPPENKAEEDWKARTKRKKKRTPRELKAEAMERKRQRYALAKPSGRKSGTPRQATSARPKGVERTANAKATVGEDTVVEQKESSPSIPVSQEKEKKKKKKKKKKDKKDKKEKKKKEKEGEEEKKQNGQEEDGSKIVTPNGDEGSTLRVKLREHIRSLKEQRAGDDKHSVHKNKKGKKPKKEKKEKKAKKEKKKRKGHDEKSSSPLAPSSMHDRLDSPTAKDTALEKNERHEKGETKRRKNGFIFSIIETEPEKRNAEAHGEKSRGKVPLKVQLERAEKLQDKIHRLKKKGIVADEIWNASLKRAHGEKVVDDPTLIKKSMKRMERKKKKSERDWKDRLDATDTRRRNLATLRAQRRTKSKLTDDKKGRKRSKKEEQGDD